MAHQEAAHAVMALIVRHSLSHHSMDIDAPSLVSGATGKTGVMTFAADLIQPEADQLKDLGALLAVTLAGAAADARIKGVDLWDALQAQPGNLVAAPGFCAQYPFAQGPDEAMALKIGSEIAGEEAGVARRMGRGLRSSDGVPGRGRPTAKAQLEAVTLPILGIKGPVGLTAAP